jgi:hypothetical protein
LDRLAGPDAAAENTEAQYCSRAWKQLEGQTLQRARVQLAFSEQKRYREPGIAKGKHKDFCALLPHERGDGVSKLEFDEVCNEIRGAFRRLATLTDLWQVALGRRDCEAEKQIWVEFDDVEQLRVLRISTTLH